MAILGCIADDFTGAADMASFLVKGGMTTRLFNGIPNTDEPAQADGLVISLKSRTQETKAAVRDSLAALEWLCGQGVTKYYIKYCSTFDSTPQGNIGPICDAALDFLGAQETILCPALPVNGRTVRDGRLYVHQIPLDESPMRDHPVTPMWDSRICTLMNAQSRYPSFREGEEPAGDIGKHYIVPDCVSDEDLERIAERYASLPLLTGGSGLAEPLARRLAPASEKSGVAGAVPGPALILSGSCSGQTRKQIDAYRAQGGLAFYLDPLRLLNGESTGEDALDFVTRHPGKPVLIYSSSAPSQVALAQRYGKEKVSGMLEALMADLAVRCVQRGVKRLIVAGGETSGSVTKRLGYDSFLIGESIAPGVPILVPTEMPDIRLVLKSGNFGKDDFFLKALEMTGG